MILCKSLLKSAEGGRGDRSTTIIPLCSFVRFNSINNSSINTEAKGIFPAIHMKCSSGVMWNENRYGDILFITCDIIFVIKNGISSKAPRIKIMIALLEKLFMATISPNPFLHNNVYRHLKKYEANKKNKLS